MDYSSSRCVAVSLCVYHCCTNWERQTNSAGLLEFRCPPASFCLLEKLPAKQWEIHLPLLVQDCQPDHLHLAAHGKGGTGTWTFHRPQTSSHVFAVSFGKECLLIRATWRLSRPKVKQKRTKQFKHLLSAFTIKKMQIFAKGSNEEMKKQNKVYSFKARNESLPPSASSCFPGVHLPGILPFCIV